MSATGEKSLSVKGERGASHLPERPDALSRGKAKTLRWFPRAAIRGREGARIREDLL